MKSLFAVIIVTIYGISIRMLFGVLNNVMGIMSISFLILLPIILGYLTVFLIMRRGPLNGVLAFFWPWATNFVILLVTMLLNIEGMICWVMIYPLASILSGIGGVVAFYSLRNSSNNKNGKSYDQDILDGNQPGTLKISFVLFLPLLIGTIEGERSLILKEINVSREVIIYASSDKVWNAIMNINEIKPKERTTSSLSSLLGFPSHLRTTLDTAAVGGKRIAYYQKGLYFEETITHYEKDKQLGLKLNIDPAKIPSAVMDEHIIIGGKYLDILEDTYTLDKLSNGNIRVVLVSHFMIRTPFNWYAGIWANYLMTDILNGQLELIKSRAEGSVRK